MKFLKKFLSKLSPVKSGFEKVSNHFEKAVAILRKLSKYRYLLALLELVDLYEEAKARGIHATTDIALYLHDYAPGDIRARATKEELEAAIPAVIDAVTKVKALTRE
jgi:hypothetical protein